MIIPLSPDDREIIGRSSTMYGLDPVVIFADTIIQYSLFIEKDVFDFYLLDCPFIVKERLCKTQQSSLRFLSAVLLIAAVNLRPFNLNKRVGSLGRARRHRGFFVFFLVRTIPALLICE